MDRRKDIWVISTYSDSYIYPAIFKGIREVLEPAGYTVDIFETLNTLEGERAVLREALLSPVAGLMVDATKGAIPNTNVDLYEELRAQGVKILFLHGNYYSYFNAPSIVQDDVGGSYLACKTLLDNGHRKIGGIFKRDDIQGRFRYKGFVKAISEAGLEVRPESIVWYELPELSIMGFMTEDFGNPLLFAKILSVIKQSTGLVIYNECAAVKVMDFAKSKGIRIPEDISVVSFDNSYLAREYDPPLTTVVHPQQVLGMKSAEIMWDMLENHRTYGTVKLPPEIIIRDSVKKIDG